MWLQLKDEAISKGGFLERTCNLRHCRAAKGSNSACQQHQQNASLHSQPRDFLNSSELHTTHSVYLAFRYCHLMPHLSVNEEELLSFCPSWGSEIERVTLFKTT